MFGLSRKKTAQPERPTMPAEGPLDSRDEPAEVSATLNETFRVLEIATLTLDGITHGLSEARLLARSAARPDGAAQRGLIAARYAFLKEDIERRSAEQALSNGEQIAIALGTDEEGRQGTLITRALPNCSFKTAEEARALADAMDVALRAVDEEATRIREAAGHVADRIANAQATPKPAMQPQAQIVPATDKSAPRRRRAA